MQQKGKSNPASKRMLNPNRKARRARSWARGQRRKAARIAEQKSREAANNEFRANGLPTPYESRQADRRRRHLDKTGGGGVE